MTARKADENGDYGCCLDSHALLVQQLSPS